MELGATLAESILAVITGQTCGEACWHASEDVCRCSCGGKNHGCLNHGGQRPGRTARIKGEFFELVAVVPGPSESECWHDAFKRAGDAFAEVMADRFPGIDQWAYGPYRERPQFPVVDRQVSESQKKWAEVQAVPGACRLIWARPKGTSYAIKAATPAPVGGTTNGEGK